jgi:hypothetical protein
MEGVQEMKQDEERKQAEARKLLEDMLYKCPKCQHGEEFILCNNHFKEIMKIGEKE